MENSHNTVVTLWMSGQLVEQSILHLGYDFPKLISLAQIVPSLPYNAICGLKHHLSNFFYFSDLSIQWPTTPKS